MIPKSEWDLFRRRWKEVRKGKHTIERGDGRYKNLEERERESGDCGTARAHDGWRVES